VLPRVQDHAAARKQTIPSFNTAKAIVPRLAMTQSCDEWVLFAMVDGKVRTCPALGWVASRRSRRSIDLPLSFTPNSTYTSKSLAWSMFHLFCKTRQLYTSPKLNASRNSTTLTAGTAADQTLFSFHGSLESLTAQLHVDSNSRFLHHSSTARTLRIIGHLASNSRVHGGGKVKAHQRLRQKQLFTPLVRLTRENFVFQVRR